MVKTYSCKFCNFQTPIKTNFIVHTNSIKHKDCIKELTIKCIYCTNDIGKLEIDSHHIVCSNKILVDKIVLIKIDEALNVAKAKLEVEYDAKLTKLNDIHRAELSKAAKKSYSSVNYQVKERKRECDNLRAEHQKVCDSLKLDHKKEYDNLKLDHKKECDNLKLDHKKEYDNLKLDHIKEIDKLKQEYKEDIDYYKKELSTANATIISAQNKHIEAAENSKKEITHVKDKQIEVIEQSKIFIANAKEKEIARMETVMKTCGKITEKSVNGICSALTFANSQLTSAPILTKICKFDFVDDCECVDELVHHYLENTIHQYIGDIIITLYKKDKAGDQSFWNTDSSRLGYIIRQKVDAQVLWGKDVNADRITKLVLTPIIEFFIECVDDRKTEEKKFIKKNDDCPKHSKMYDRIIKKEAFCKNLILVKTALLDTKLNKNIIKYITPKFNISALMLAKK
jgi:hypothetical protein